jgi:hypothetical protein
MQQSKEKERQEHHNLPSSNSQLKEKMRRARLNLNKYLHLRNYHPITLFILSICWLKNCVTAQKPKGIRNLTWRTSKYWWERIGQHLLKLLVLNCSKSDLVQNSMIWEKSRSSLKICWQVPLKERSIWLLRSERTKRNSKRLWFLSFPIRFN